MSTEALLPVHLEVTLAVVYDNLVVHGLSSEVFHVGMHGGCRHGMHVRLTDVLGHYRYTKLPDVHFLVVSRRYEASTVLNEGDCVD